MRQPSMLIRYSLCPLGAVALLWLPMDAAFGQDYQPARAEAAIVRRTVGDFQRDPVRLVKEFSLNPSTRHLAFDLAPTAEAALGAATWNKLDAKHRQAVSAAFERTVRELWETWDSEEPLSVRVLKSEVSGKRAVLTVLRGEACFRLTLVQRGAAWFIVEHEIVDDALPEFADALRGALKPETRRGLIYEVSFAEAFKHLDGLLTAEGEQPELLLLKARVHSSQQAEEESAQLLAELKAGAPQPLTPPATRTEPIKDHAVALLQQIITRWPDFAPAHLALGRELLYSNNTEGVINPLSKDAQQAIAALQRYARLAPYDPRPWRDLATAFAQLERFVDAEAAYHAAIERDPTYLDHHAALVQFHLDHEATTQAKTAFAKLLAAAPDPDEAFAVLFDEEGFDPDSAKLLEELLAAFPKELPASKVGLSLLAEVQAAQNKLSDAIKNVQRAIAIEAEADDYIYLSQLYRRQRRFTEALNAAHQSNSKPRSSCRLVKGKANLNATQPGIAVRLHKPNDSTGNYLL
jgi:tetratricopeptide (TPR) repeat protein